MVSLKYPVGVVLSSSRGGVWNGRSGTQFPAPLGRVWNGGVRPEQRFPTLDGERVQPGGRVWRDRYIPAGFREMVQGRAGDQRGKNH